jgi:AcrR family transcriptional regulator
VKPVAVRRRSPRGQGEQLRASILQSAAALLAETGREEEVSIRAVAERVGVTPPSIYLHFADKDALLDAVCIEAFTDFDETMRAAAAGEDDALDALRALGRAYVDFARSRPEHYRLMFMRRPGAGVEEPTEAEITAVAGLSSVIDTVRLAQERGVLADDDPVRLALTLWAGVHGVATLLIAKPHFPWGDTDDLVERVLEMCLHGVAATTPAVVSSRRRRSSARS